MKFATVAATVALSSSLAANAIAEERQVVVLNPRGNAFLSPWPEGTRAVIAELATSEDQVLVRPSTASTFAALMRELELAADENRSVGAVCVGQSGSAGIAYVWVRGGSSAIRVEDDLRQGAVAEGALALRVSELLHVRSVELPSTPRPEPRTPTAAPPPALPRPDGPSPFLGWLGVGALTSSGTSGPVPMVSAGARFSPVTVFGVEAAATSSFGWLSVETDAGTADVDLRALTLHAVLDPWAESSASLSLALGGGIAWAAAVADPLPGFVSRYDSTAVGLLTARLGAVLRAGRIGVVGFVEPGLLLPPVTLAADESELARLGRPWFAAMLGVGFSP